MASLVLVQGDSVSETVRITDKNNAAIDITGGTVKFRIVSDIDDLVGSALYANAALTLSDPTNGIATLTITRTVTKAWTPGKYYWEVEYIDSGSLYSHTTFQPCTIVQSIYAGD